MEQIVQFCLIGTGIQEDTLHQRTHCECSRPVFGTVDSAAGSEFTSAGVLGIRAEYRITMFFPDYHGELEAVLCGRRYTIYRTYQPTADKIELYLSQKAGDTL